LHGWQETQLVALQERLKNSDFVALHVGALKCARALLIGSIEDGDFVKAMFMASGDNLWTRLTRHPELLLITLAPRGSRYERATSVSMNFRHMINALTPADGIIHPGEATKAFASWKRAQQGLPVVLRIQTLVNEGQIACALERYRLAQGTYPETLDTLVPQFIEKLPRDIVNGAPLLYRRVEDGTFLLYSDARRLGVEDFIKTGMTRPGLSRLLSGDIRRQGVECQPHSRSKAATLSGAAEAKSDLHFWRLGAPRPVAMRWP
jgi:hypothetical protein